MIYLQTATYFAFGSVVTFGFCRVAAWTWVRQWHAAGIAARMGWVAIRLVALFGALAPMFLLMILFDDWSREQRENDVYGWFLIVSWILSLAPGFIWAARRRRELEGRLFR